MFARKWKAQTWETNQDRGDSGKATRLDMMRLVCTCLGICGHTGRDIKAPQTTPEMRE